MIERVEGRMYRSSGFIEALEIIMSNLPRIGLRNVKPLELAILQTSEDADDALRIMADVRAYFQGMCFDSFFHYYHRTKIPRAAALDTIC